MEYRLTFEERLNLFLNIAIGEDHRQLVYLALRLDELICFDDPWSYIEQGEFED